MKVEASNEFQRWATGYSGCDGGNLKGSIWFCGIEFGGGHDSDSFKFHDVSAVPYIAKEDIAKKLKYQYNRKAAKVYAALIGQPGENYREVAIRDELFGRNSNAFKLNLFPISFKKDRNELWEEWLYDLTGLPTKSLYRAWCQINRFPVIREWMAHGSPKLIVATGLSYRDQFNIAFSGTSKAFEPFDGEECIVSRRVMWKRVNSGKTILAVTPFFGGPSGLNSDNQLDKIGGYLRQLCESEFGNRWLWLNV